MKLTRALLEFYQQNIPDPVLKPQLESILAFFLGKEASKAVGISSKLQVPGDILGLMLKATGFKTFGAQKNYLALKKNLDSQQILLFGKILQLNIPVLK